MGLVGLVEFFWHINHCRLFNVKYSLYIYIKNIRFLQDAKANSEYSSKRLCNKTRLILILENKQQNKIDKKSKFTQYGHHFFKLFYQHAFETT